MQKYVRMWHWQGSVLAHPLFLIYINVQPDGITSMCKIFANDTSSFSKVLDVNKSVIELNPDLEKIKQWSFNVKCNLTLIAINKQSYFFLRSLFHITYLILKFHERIINKCNSQKHLGIILDLNLNFNTHIDQKI